MKKGHPCSFVRNEILRVVADFRLKCMGCGHQILGTAEDVLEKNTKSSKKKEK